MRYLHPQLQKLMAERSWVELDSDTTSFLESKLLSFPFLGSGIDWSVVPHHKSLNRVGLSDAAECQWLVEQTAFGACEFAVVFYAPDKPSYIRDRESVLANLDLIFWKAPAKRYVFAVNYVESGKTVSPFAILEYGGGDMIRVVELPTK